MKQKEEMITEVDRNDKVIGLRPRSDFYTGKHIHRGTQLILKNSKGEILIQKRSKTKRWFPGLLNFSAGGVVSTETCTQSIIKEAKEELGIDIIPKKLFKIYLNIDTANAFNTIYTATSNSKIIVQKEELDWAKWVKESELKKDLKQHPEKYTPVFVECMKKYFIKNKKI